MLLMNAKLGMKKMIEVKYGLDGIFYDVMA